MAAADENGQPPPLVAFGDSSAPDQDHPRRPTAPLSSQIAPAPNHHRHDALPRRHSTGSFKTRRRSSLMNGMVHAARRPSSLLKDLQTTIRQAVPLYGGGSSDGTPDEEDGEADIAGSKFNAMVANFIDTNISSRETIEAQITVWHRQYFVTGRSDASKAHRQSPVLNDHRQYLAFFEGNLPTHIARLIELEQNHRIAKVRCIRESVWFSSSFTRTTLLRRKRLYFGR